MKFFTLFRPLGLGLVFLIVTSCMEEPLKVDLDNTNLNLESQELYDITGQTYQIPPIIGSKTKLYLGEEDGFEYKAMLFSASYISSESYYSTISSFLDTSITIDSAFFTIGMSKDTLVDPISFSMYYFPYQADSIFNESKTHYLNFTDSEIASGVLVSSTIEESYAVDSTTTKFRLRFPAEDLFDSTFADTSMNYTLMVRSDESLDELISFYSREYDYTQTLTPKLEVFYREFTYPDSGDTSTSIDIDTLVRTFYTTKDISIMVPPEISEEDTSYITIGRGKGLRSVLKLNFLDSLMLPAQTSYDLAQLIFYMVPDTNITSFSVWAAPLTDTLDLSGFSYMEEDDYSIEGTMLSSGSLYDGKITINIKDFLQNQYFKNVENLGLKLYANINNNLHRDIHLYSAEHDSLYPRLKIRYVSP